MAKDANEDQVRGATKVGGEAASPEGPLEWTWGWGEHRRLGGEPQTWLSSSPSWLTSYTAWEQGLSTVSGPQWPRVFITGRGVGKEYTQKDLAF